MKFLGKIHSWAILVLLKAHTMKFVEGDGNAVLNFNLPVLLLCIVNTFDIVMIQSYSMRKCYVVGWSVRLRYIGFGWLRSSFVLTKSRVLIKLLALNHLGVCLRLVVIDRMICTFCALSEVVYSTSLVPGQEGTWGWHLLCHLQRGSHIDCLRRYLWIDTTSHPTCTERSGTKGIVYSRFETK